MPYELFLEVQGHAEVRAWVEVVLIIEIFGIHTLIPWLTMKLLHTRDLQLLDFFLGEGLVLGWRRRTPLIQVNSLLLHELSFSD